MSDVRRHWARVEMYRHAAELFRRAAPSLDVYEVSGDAFRDLLPWKSYFSTYGLDVCELAEDLGADLCVLDQVLEHVVDPLRALKNVRARLRPGGMVFVSTPFLIRYHPDPVDLWRWTPRGLELLLARAGFRDVDAWGWGNAACVRANLGDWADVPDEGPGPNDQRFPVTVWAVATR